MLFNSRSILEEVLVANEKVKPNVNGGAGGGRNAGRQIIKDAAKKARRKESKQIIDANKD